MAELMSQVCPEPLWQKVDTEWISHVVSISKRGKIFIESLERCNFNEDDGLCVSEEGQHYIRKDRQQITIKLFMYVTATELVLVRFMFPSPVQVFHVK